MANAVSRTTRPRHVTLKATTLTFAAATCALALLWGGSCLLRVGCQTTSGLWVDLRDGCLVVGKEPASTKPPAGWFARFGPEPMDWWFYWGRASNGWMLVVPIWVAMITVGIGTISIWRLQARLGVLSGHVCRECGYDLSGLGVSTLCPECGAQFGAAGWH